MNPAVVAPDGFDVLERSAGSALQPDVRHLLGTIARMLQHAAANKHFHGDGGHIRALNEYISQMHGKFRSVNPTSGPVQQVSLFVQNIRLTW